MPSYEVAVGDVVRLYGYPGQFTVMPFTPKYESRDEQVGVGRDGEFLFPALTSSIVEINGAPVPMRSCPISHPASDYPHVPEFDYDDGPAGNAVDAVRAWRRVNPFDRPGSVCRDDVGHGSSAERSEGLGMVLRRQEGDRGVDEEDSGSGWPDAVCGMILKIGGEWS